MRGNRHTFGLVAASIAVALALAGAAAAAVIGHRSTRPRGWRRASP